MRHDASAFPDAAVPSAMKNGRPIGPGAQTRPVISFTFAECRLKNERQMKFGMGTVMAKFAALIGCASLVLAVSHGVGHTLQASAEVVSVMPLGPECARRAEALIPATRLELRDRLQGQQREEFANPGAVPAWEGGAKGRDPRPACP